MPFLFFFYLHTASREIIDKTYQKPRLGNGELGFAICTPTYTHPQSHTTTHTPAPQFYTVFFSFFRLQRLHRSLCKQKGGKKAGNDYRNTDDTAFLLRLLLLLQHHHHRSTPCCCCCCCWPASGGVQCISYRLHSH